MLLNNNTILSPKNKDNDKKITRKMHKTLPKVSYRFDKFKISSFFITNRKP